MKLKKTHFYGYPPILLHVGNIPDMMQSKFSQHITVQTNTSKSILRNLCKMTLKLRIDVPIKVLF